MCGRYSQFKEINELKIRFNLDRLVGACDDLLFDKPRYNIAPTQIVPVICHAGSKTMRLMSWGLVPSWTNDHASGNKMINARAETIAEKPTFKRLLGAKRCIVPATGFYEWAKKGPYKTPMHIVLKDRGPFGFAGLWDVQKYTAERDFYSYTIITTSSNELMEKIHNRMPVILKREDEDRWLDPDLKDLNELLSMLKPYSGEEMEAYEVSRAVNSPANDGPECVEEAR